MKKLRIITNMEKLKEYCKNVIKVDHILTKDFLYIAHNLIESKLVKLVKLVSEVESFTAMQTMPIGVVFYFEKIYFKDAESMGFHLSRKWCEDSSYILHCGSSRMKSTFTPLNEALDKQF